jgi:hypothetical protein
MPELKCKPVRVTIWESEAGWGTSLEGEKWFDNRIEAEAFVKDYNKDLPARAPSYYWYARVEN